MGHVRDLPSKGMGVDLETFQPDYVLIEERGKDKLVGELKKLARQSDVVYLATDLDREGEAIAWHLKEALGVSDDRAGGSSSTRSPRPRSSGRSPTPSPSTWTG
jgi:DNA topoisomerase-1